MNRKILQKVIDNLNTEKPDLSYIKGILETLLESLPEDKSTLVRVPTPILPITPTTTDEPVMALENRVATNLSEIKKMAGQ